MKTLYFDCISGISGDMTIGALLDLGIDKKKFTEELKKISCQEFEMTIEKVSKNGISALSFNVIVEDERQSKSNMDEGSHVHRNFTDILKIIDESKISDNAKDISMRIFRRLAVAESKIHGTTPEEVMFHEVGAVDSIVDIIGTAICIDLLAPDKIYTSALNDGYGFTHCQHGKIPIPVPAVVELLSDSKIKINQIDVNKELVTPTGAGIVSELAIYNSKLPQMKINKVGYGAGQRDMEHPNVLRVFLGEVENAKKEEDSLITILETNIDDCSPQVLSYTMECLFENGARDVYFTNIYMKKNRPAIMLTVLCDSDKAEIMQNIIFKETTTIGIRVREEKRIVLDREIKEIDTKYGKLKAKTVYFSDSEKVSIEYEDAKKIAKKNNVPIKDILKL